MKTSSVEGSKVKWREHTGEGKSGKQIKLFFEEATFEVGRQPRSTRGPRQSVGPWRFGEAKPGNFCLFGLTVLRPTRFSRNRRALIVAWHFAAAVPRHCRESNSGNESTQYKVQHCPRQRRSPTGIVLGVDQHPLHAGASCVLHEKPTLFILRDILVPLHTFAHQGRSETSPVHPDTCSSSIMTRWYQGVSAELVSTQSNGTVR